MSDFRTCPSCRKWVPKGDEECPHCGARVDLVAMAKSAALRLIGAHEGSRKNLLCVSCSRVVGENAESCPHCGANQTAARRIARHLLGGVATPSSATPILIGVMVMLFILQGLMGLGQRDFKLFDFLLTGDRLTTAMLGGLLGGFIDYGGQWWRLVNSNFLHFGVIHLYFNMSALRALGSMVEEEYGTGWYLFAFLLTGIAGFYVSYLVSPEAFTVGASASLFGLIGVGIGYAYRERERRSQQLKTLVKWAAFGIGIGFLGIIPMNNAAHLGGLLSGLVFGLVLTPKVANQRGIARTAGGFLGNLSVLVALLGFILAVLAREETHRLIFG